MDEWPKFSIGDLIESGAIKIQKDGNHGANYPRNSDFGDVGLPFLTAKSLSDWHIDIANAPRLSEEKAATFKFGFVAEGDVLLSHNATVGRVAVMPKCDGPVVIGTSLTQYRVDQEIIDPWFLALYFSSRDFQNELSFSMSQTTRNQVPITAQRRLPVAIPPISIQRQIVGTVYPFIKKIELNRRMNETLEAMARAIFKDWFVDFGPTCAKMEGREPHLAPEIWDLFPDALDDLDKPVGWDIHPLTDFFEIVGGGTPKTSVSEYWGGDIPWFSVVDTPPKGCVFVVETEKNITERGLKESSSRLVPEGTTIISARGTVGNLAMATREMAFNQSCYALRANDRTGDHFVYLAAENLVTQLKSMAHGSVFSTITRQTFDAVSLPMPSNAAMRAFETLVEPLFLRIKSNVQEARTLAQTRDLLLPKLMSGEIPLREAEKTVEAEA